MGKGHEKVDCLSGERKIILNGSKSLKRKPSLKFQTSLFTHPPSIEKAGYLVISYMRRMKLKEFCNFVAKTRFGFGRNHKGNFAED